MSKTRRTFYILILLHVMPMAFANEFGSVDKPWSTGALINNGAIKVSKGQFSSFTDFYNNQNLGLQQWGVYSQNVYGVSEHWSVQLIPAYNMNVFEGKEVTGWGDFPTVIAYQLTHQERGHNFPSIKINFTQVFPTGRFKDLDINNNGFDAIGLGSYVVGVIVNTEYLSMPIPDHFLDTYFSLGYAYWTPAKVDNTNSYGGGVGTSGKVSSSQEFLGDLAFEFHLDKHWGAVFELYYLFISEASFKGQAGRSLEGEVAQVLRQGTNQWSIAPAIEYNVSANLGFIAGVWLSLNDDTFNKFKSVQVAVSLSLPDL